MGLKAQVRKSNEEYFKGRIEDFRFYVARSDLSKRLIAKCTGVPEFYIKAILKGSIKKPNDIRMSRVIEFIKDFERLQSYYIALGRRNK